MKATLIAVAVIAATTSVAAAGILGVDYAFLQTTNGQLLNWQDDPPVDVPYWVHQEVIDAGYLGAVQAAFQAWENDPGSDVSYVYRGSTTTESDIKLLSNGTYSNPSDGKNVVSFQPLGSIPVTFPDGSVQMIPILGRGGLAYTTNSLGTTLQFDVTLTNSHASVLSVGASPGRTDVQTVMMHEIGHALGLGHPSNPNQVMSALLPQNSTAFRTLQAGDREGVGILYPAPAVPSGPTCNGLPVTINMAAGDRGVGTNGPDVILGTESGDRIFGLGGDDVICGEGGVDRIYGGDGADTIYGGGSSDRIRAGAGNDTIFGGSGADRMWGDIGDDAIYGGGGQDRMYGQAGNDTLQGNHSSDDIWGGDGNDVIRGSKGKDDLYGDAGNDQLFGGVNTDRLVGGAGADTLDGQQGNDTCIDTPGTPFTSC